MILHSRKKLKKILRSKRKSTRNKKNSGNVKFRKRKIYDGTMPILLTSIENILCSEDKVKITENSKFKFYDSEDTSILNIYVYELDSQSYICFGEHHYIFDMVSGEIITEIVNKISSYCSENKARLFVESDDIFDNLKTDTRNFLMHEYNDHDETKIKKSILLSLSNTKSLDKFKFDIRNKINSVCMQSQLYDVALTIYHNFKDNDDAMNMLIGYIDFIYIKPYLIYLFENSDIFSSDETIKSIYEEILSYYKNSINYLVYNYTDKDKFTKYLDELKWKSHQITDLYLMNNLLKNTISNNIIYCGGAHAELLKKYFELKKFKLITEMHFEIKTV